MHDSASGNSGVSSGSVLEARVVAAVRHVEQNRDREVSVAELAALARLSPFHFHRLFRAVTGEATGEFSRRIRLEHAAYRLRATSWPVTRVAVEVGYDSADAFTRAFRGRFGLTPTAFRRACKSGDQRPTSPLPVVPDRRTMERGGASHHDIAIRRIPAMTLACLRHIGPYQTVWRTWQALDEWAVEKGLETCTMPSIRYGMSHDDPSIVEETKLRYDAALRLPATRVGLQPPRRSPTQPIEVRTGSAVSVQEIPDQRYAIITHAGAYHRLGLAYESLYAWLLGSGHEPANGPPLEWYRNEVRVVGESGLLTDILLPIR